MVVWQADTGALRLIAMPWAYANPEKPGVYGNDGRDIEIFLPVGSPVNAIEITVVNMSPETDGWIVYSTVDGLRRHRFAMMPRTDVVQVILCELQGTSVDGRLVLRLLPLGKAGAVDLLCVRTTTAVPPGSGGPRSLAVTGYPQISIPGLPRDCFDNAWRVMEGNTVTAVPSFGFEHPFVDPGGQYSECWWALDSSLVWGSIKWCNPAFAVANLRDFRSAQVSNGDGRIDLYGMSPVRGTASFVSSLPLLLEYAAQVAMHVGSESVRRLTTDLIADNLRWWLSDIKTDPSTGLATGFFEEAFGLPEEPPGRLIPVDLNVCLIVACDALIALLRRSGDDAEALSWVDRRAQLAAAFQEHLWNENAGIYRDRRVDEGFLPNTLSTAFDALRAHLSPPERASSAVRLLTSERFKWEARAPLTSMSTDSPDFTEVEGGYHLSAWRGNVWTLRNVTVIRALRESGNESLAAVLTWKTISAFANNYWEFLAADTARGHGVADYSWSASQTIELAIDFVLGLSFDGDSRTLRCSPLPIAELFGKTIEATGLALNGAATFDVTLTWSIDGSEADVEVRASEPGCIKRIDVQMEAARLGDNPDEPHSRASGHLIRAVLRDGSDNGASESS
jgi:hypothetical protein